MVELMKYRTISSQIVVDEAKKLWYTVEVIDKEKNLFYISNWTKTILFKNIDAWLNSSLWLKLAEDKELTWKVLERYGVSVPETVYVDALEYCQTHTSFPCVVKPIDGSKWTDVNVNIMDQSELQRVLEKLLPIYWRVIVQDMITGDDHRLLMIWDQLVSATLRKSPYVIGDWTLTIKQLIEKENTLDLRWKWHTKPLTEIPIDEITKWVVEKAWYSLDSIPKEWISVFVRWNCNLSTWWTSEDVTKRIPPETIEQCRVVMKELNLWMAGIDVVSDDIGIPLNKQWAIIEVNATPGLRMHVYPSVWESINVGKVILERIFNT
jgi:cyanophycin synthetase